MNVLICILRFIVITAIMMTTKDGFWQKAIACAMCVVLSVLAFCEGRFM